MPEPIGNKKDLYPNIWDKSRCFCDTTQFDVPLKNVRSLTRTIIRAPMDNGWESRRSLLGGLCALCLHGLAPMKGSGRVEQSVQSALRSPFASRFPFRFHHPELSEGLPRRLLLFVTGFVACELVGIYYNHRCGFCQGGKTHKL